MKINIVNVDGDVMASCPKCGNVLEPVDVDRFQKCPYCNAEFDKDAAFDDFLVSGRVRELLGDWHGLRK